MTGTFVITTANGYTETCDLREAQARLANLGVPPVLLPGDYGDHGAYTYMTPDEYDDFGSAEVSWRTIDPSVITLFVSVCAARFGYVATFEGPQAETTALAFVADRSSTHAFDEIPEASFSHAAYPALAAKLYPLCDHGMSASNCYGPEHFCSPEEIAQGW